MLRIRRPLVPSLPGDPAAAPLTFLLIVIEAAWPSKKTAFPSPDVGELEL